MPTDADFCTCLDLHARRYPLMQAQDLAKLAYQAAFAGGHLIADEDAALRYLQEEYAAVLLQKAAPQPAELFEPIGNGLCRLHLLPLAHSGLDLQTAGRLFILTSNEHRGAEETLLAHLDCVSQAVASGLPLHEPLQPERWTAYLDRYQEQGYPPVHHSAPYRQAYHPAYRVVRAEFARISPLLAAIDQQLLQKERLTVAVDGNSGAGKSTLAAWLHQLYGGNLFHMDDFFLQPQMRTAERFAQPGGNVDHERFQAEIIRGLASGQPFSYRIYDCRKQELGKPVLVQPARFNLVEGVYSLHPKLIRAYDITVLMRISPRAQRQRILARSGPELYQRFIDEWIPLEDRYFAARPLSDKCDFVFDIQTM